MFSAEENASHPISHPIPTIEIGIAADVQPYKVPPWYWENRTLDSVQDLRKHTDLSDWKHGKRRNPQCLDKARLRQQLSPPDKEH